MNNALLAGLPKLTLNKLQRCQNIAARVVTRTSVRDHITPVLKDLHWLPVTQRIDYKILLHVYKALNGLGPAYITDMLHLYRPARSLRSADSHQLEIPRTCHSWGDRAFSKAAPVLWNSMPQSIRMSASLGSFKSSVKTILFRAAYP